MKNLILSCCAIGLFLLSSCANVYYAPDAKSRANKHKIFAVLPPKVTIAANKKVDAEAIKEQQKSESNNFQKEMYSWLLRRKSQGKMRVEVLDVETTNAKLTKLGYFDSNTNTPAELAEALGVDAVLTSNYSLSKPMSEGAAVAVGVIFGVWGRTNETAVSLELYDKQEKKLLWSFNHELGGSIGSSPAQLVDALMRKASKKMPYIME